MQCKEHLCSVGEGERGESGFYQVVEWMRELVLFTTLPHMMSEEKE